MRTVDNEKSNFRNFAGLEAKVRKFADRHKMRNEDQFYGCAQMLKFLPCVSKVYDHLEETLKDLGIEYKFPKKGSVELFAGYSRDGQHQDNFVTSYNVHKEIRLAGQVVNLEVAGNSKGYCGYVLTGQNELRGDIRLSRDGKEFIHSEFQQKKLEDYLRSEVN
ncbi:hypothetical protein HOC13_03840 [Candidatus Woesearchaeota archaeon]|jgi:hypothetical protein|nr:hypothetical protein [Candidatus Woesearchaeota archaeon]